MFGNNTIKTAALFAALTALFIVVGRLLGGTGGMIVAFLLAMVMNVGSYWFSDKMVLKLSGAKEASPKEYWELHESVEALASRAHLPKPKVWVIDSPTPNALATGRNHSHSSVAVTTGLLNRLNKDEVTAVLAHELAHVSNRDILISTIVATIASAITTIANLAQWAFIFGGLGGGDDSDDDGGLGSLVGSLLMIVLAPLAASLIQLAISRSREYAADAKGAGLLGDPLVLARALEKLETANRMQPMPVNPAVGHAFTVQALPQGGFNSLFSTHPPTSERIARLQKLALRPQPWG